MNVSLSRVCNSLLAVWVLGVTTGCDAVQRTEAKVGTAELGAAEVASPATRPGIVPPAPAAALASDVVRGASVSPPSSVPAPVARVVPGVAAVPAVVTKEVDKVAVDTNALSAAVSKPEVVDPPNLSVPLQEVAKLARAGVNEDVMLAYVEKGTNTFKLSAEELIFLSDVGVAPAVITAMQRKSATAGNVAAAPATPPTPPTQVITPTYVTNPAPTVAGPVTGVGEQPPVVIQEPAPVTSVTYFYDALTPHGTWIDVGGYGRCWRPDYGALGANWRPYSDGGRWIWTAHGWYWHSDYAWGWAPFHYGRWCHVDRHGWIWNPDTTWGPAWVCWRRTSSHCGWAPLPPEAHYYAGSGWRYRGIGVGFDFGFELGFSHFSFIPWGRFCDSRPRHFYASSSHASSLYRDSRVINNTIVGNNNTIVFEGVGRQEAARASRTPIPQASLRETAWTSAQGGTRESLNQGANGLVLQSPRLSGVAPSRVGAGSGSGKGMGNSNARSGGSTPALSGVPTSTSTLSRSASTATDREQAIRATRGSFSTYSSPAAGGIPTSQGLSSRSQTTSPASSVTRVEPPPSPAVPARTPPVSTSLPARGNAQTWSSASGNSPAPIIQRGRQEAAESGSGSGTVVPRANPVPSWMSDSTAIRRELPPRIVGGGYAEPSPTPRRITPPSTVQRSPSFTPVPMDAAPRYATPPSAPARTFTPPAAAPVHRSITPSWSTPATRAPVQIQRFAPSPAASPRAFSTPATRSVTPAQPAQSGSNRKEK